MAAFSKIVKGKSSVLRQEKTPPATSPPNNPPTHPSGLLVTSVTAGLWLSPNPGRRKKGSFCWRVRPQ